jgi:hypothetical protein
MSAKADIALHHLEDFLAGAAQLNPLGDLCDL